MDKLSVVVFNLILSAVAIAVAYTAFVLDRLFPFLLPEFMMLFAWPLISFGALIIIWAVIALFRLSGASGAPGDPTRKLVTTGPYAWIRNPIYAGDVIIILGLAFLTRSPSMFIYAWLFGFGMNVYVRFIEEPATANRLGEAYLKYKENVPRWFPKIKRESEIDR